MAYSKGIILYDFLRVRGGAERLTLTLARGLTDVDLGIGYRDPEAFSEQEIVGIRCYDLRARTSIVGWRSVKVMQAFARKTKFLSKYDWVLYSGTYAPLAVMNHWSGRNVLYSHTLPRFVYDLRDYYLQRHSWFSRPALKAFAAYVKPRFEAAVERMDLIIANSENVRGRIRRYLGKEAVVVHPPCDVDGFGWLGQEDYYLSTARLECFKRVDVIIQAFKRMPEKRLVVASGGREAARLRRLAEGASNIQFAGWLDDQGLRCLMGRAIATIYIPKDEDYGMSLVESMAAGKPVIGVAEGGLLETLVHGETGLLLPPDPEPDHLIAAVQELTRERARQLRAACEARAAQFSREIFLERMRQILEVG